jgi:hypothetical protein
VVNRLDLREKKVKKKQIIALNKKTCRLLIEGYIETERPVARHDEPPERKQETD